MLVGSSNSTADVVEYFNGDGGGHRESEEATTANSD